VRIAVNLSPAQIGDPDLVTVVERALADNCLDPARLELEITESTVMQNTEYVIDTFNRIKQLGLKLAIDDFGTGYASLNYLKRMPITAVKIDQTFIQGIPKSLQDAALTSAIITIAHQLGLTVVAEGVETKTQYDFLKNEQCNFMQGNFFSVPVSGNEFGKLLQS
jgi:EAL domain-containing protein (putative c-di-GMP-specific phosphodiesterase class I)